MRFEPAISLLLCAALSHPLHAYAQARHRDQTVAAAGDGELAGPDHCPFTFENGMPPAVFCVYSGVALRSDGQLCSDRMMVVWARLSSEPDSRGGREELNDRAAVHFGFVSAPDLVMRARVDAGAENRASLLDFTSGPLEPHVAVRGHAELRTVSSAALDGPDILSIRVSHPVPAGGACSFTSYDGTFVGQLVLNPVTLQ